MLRGPPRRPARALRGPEALAGCTHAIHLAGIVEGAGAPHTLTEVNNALSNAVVRAALDADVARFVYVSSQHRLRARDGVPHPRGARLGVPAAASAYGFSKLTGEMYCRAAPPSTASATRSAARSTPTGPAAPTTRSSPT